MLVCVICGIFATMNDERLSRHITQDNLRLRSDNSQLKKQMEEKDIMLNSKDDQILSLLNQIATDMVKRSDVDEIVKKAVSEEHDRLVSYYEGRMRSMAAEYEAKIAELKKGRGKKGGNGGNSVGSNRKPNTQTFDTKEEAVAALEEAQKKALAMADQAFGKGSEKLTAEQKPATDPQEEAADDDSKVKSPVQQRGDYGEKDYVSTPRSTDYCQYGDVDDDDITHNYFFPEGCDANSAIYGERTKEQWEITLPRLCKIINHLFRCRVNGKKVWAKMPDGLLKNAHLGPRYSTNMILNKYLNGMSENKTERTLEYQIGMNISRKTVNTHVNKLLSGIRSFMEERFRWWILQDDYLGIDETVEDVFVDCEDGKRHLRTRYHWGIYSSAFCLAYFIYDQGSRSRKVIQKFLEEFLGTIQTDGASMYKIFEKHPELGITRLSCLVHIRRYFRKALKFETDNGIARRFLDKIQLIYKFEERYKKDKLPPDKVKEHRQTDILPILGDILQELNHYATSAAEECGSLLMKAIHYAMAEWNGLMRYTSDGRYRADNNMTEQLMRDLASGRKNFLFSGSDEAAKNFAFAYSLTQSCKLNHANPYAYWEDLIANAHNPNRTIDSFMPHLWGKNL